MSILKMEKSSEGYLKPPLCSVIHTLWPFVIQQNLQLHGYALSQPIPLPVPAVTPVKSNLS